MTPDQLASARAAHWREDAQPILTLDDAKAWLERMQLCLYLPRKSQLLAPAPSFAGAVLGGSTSTPPPETIQQAHDYLVRLVVEGFVVPLNLFGTPGEQPDFLVVTSALAQIAALQADRNWKKPPARTGPGKVSPLAIEIWKLLEHEGVLTATEIREQLGHELTEAATIRGLSELWQNMRVAPLPQGAGEPAHWEILSTTHKKEMAKGSTMSQSTALSLLVSDYVQSVLTATAEDIEAFLSPVASRSRLRDVIRGLGATRQLKTLSMDAQTFLFVEGTLPEMPEASAESSTTGKPAFMGRSAYRERMLKKTKDEGKSEEERAADTSPSTYRERHGETGTDRPRAAFSDRPRPGSDRPARSGPPRRDTGSREGGASRPSRFGAGSSSPRPPRPSFGDRARGTSNRPPFRERPSGTGDRPFRPSTEGDRSRPERSGTESRPFTPRPSGSRPSFGAKPFAPREGSRPSFRDRPAAGGDRPFRPRTDGDRPRPERSDSQSRPFTPRPSGSRPSFGAKPFTPREGSRPSFRDRPAAGGDRPFRPRTDGDRPRPERSGSEGRSSTPRPSFGTKSFTPREGSRPPFRDKRASGDRPFRPRTDGDRQRPAGRSFSPREGSARPPFRDKPTGSGDRPFRPRPDGDRPRSDRPRTDSRERPSSDRPSFPRREGSSRPGSSRPGSSRPNSGRPSFGSSSSGRPPRPSGSFTRRDGPPSSGRPSSGRPSFSGRSSSEGRSAGRPSSSSRPSSGRPSSGSSFSGGAGGRSAGRPPARPGSRPGSPGRNPGGTGRPGGPRPGGSSPRPGGGRPGGPRAGDARPGGPRPNSPRPGGMRPPTRKPKKDDD